MADLDGSWPLLPPSLPGKVVVGFTDASDTHYGLVLRRRQRSVITTIPIQELEKHITWKELSAVHQFLLKHHRLRNCVLKLGIDNMATIACLSKQHTMSAAMAPMLSRILVECESRGIHIHPFYVPSELNPADEPSRPCS